MEVFLGLVLAAAEIYFARRTYVLVKERRPAGQEISYLVYLPVIGLLWIVYGLFPQWSAAAKLLCAGLAVAVGFALSYVLNRRYRRWLDEEAKKREDGGR